MFDGSTGGRGFESPLAPWIWGALVVLGVAFWVWEHIRIRRLERDEDDEEDG